MADSNAKNNSGHVSPPAQEVTERSMTPDESRQELRDAIRGSNQILATATTVLAFFPDTLTVDRAKLTVTKRSFFGTAEVMSMRIEDVLNVTCTVGPVFGTVKLMSRVMNSDQSSTVGKFWRKDASRLKRITQGYIIALQRNIDCSNLSTKELSNMLDKLGQDTHKNSA